MTISFDQVGVAFDSAVYTFDGVSLASPDTASVNAQITIDTRALFNAGWYRASICQTTNANWHE